MKVHSESKATSREHEFEKRPAQEEQQRVQDWGQTRRIHRQQRVRGDDETNEMDER